MGHPADNRLAVVRKVVCGHTDDHADHQTHRRGSPDPPLKALQKPGGCRRQKKEEHRRGIGRGIQRLGGISVLSHAGAGNPNNGSQKSQGGVAEDHRRAYAHAAVQRLGHHQCRGHSRHVGIEEIRAHTGHIAHVVAYVIRDHGRIARVILRDSQLHLARQIRRHVGRLRKDTAARLGKEGQRTRPKGEAQKHRGVRRKHQHRHHAQQAEAHHRKPHDGPAPEADEERGLQPLLGSLRRPGIGLSRHQDTDFPGDGRQDGSAQIGDGHGQIIRQLPIPDGTWQKNQDQQRRDARKPGENHIFLPHKGIRARADEARDLQDPRVRRRLPLHPEMQIHRIGEGNHNSKK